MGCVSSKTGDNVISGDGAIARHDSSTSSAPSSQEAPSWAGGIAAPRAWKVEPALTAAQLSRLRAEFWETRVEGRPEMWQALRFAAEEAKAAPDLALQTVLAAGLRPARKRPTLQAVFDERGALYEVPIFALADPSNLDEAPVCKEFKDAARVVDDYLKARERSKRQQNRPR